jgi:hypothetical protein
MHHILAVLFSGSHHNSIIELFEPFFELLGFALFVIFYVNYREVIILAFLFSQL